MNEPSLRTNDLRLCGVPGCQEVANVCAAHFGSSNVMLNDVRAENERLHGELNFISGYLLEHRQMLKDNGVHPKIVDAVLWLEKRIATLTALRVSENNDAT